MQKQKTCDAMFMKDTFIVELKLLVSYSTLDQYGYLLYHRISVRSDEYWWTNVEGMSSHLLDYVSSMVLASC